VPSPGGPPVPGRRPHALRAEGVADSHTGAFRSVPRVAPSMTGPRRAGLHGPRRPGCSGGRDAPLTERDRMGLDKAVDSAAEAVADVAEGASLAVGGFG